MIRIYTTVLLLLATQAIQAGPGYSEPVLRAVPIMSPFALGGLVVILAVAGYRVLRNRR